MRTPKIIALHNLIDWLNFNIPDCDRITHAKRGLFKIHSLKMS